MEMFHRINKSDNCNSLLKKHLTIDIIKKLKENTTSHNATLADCIRSGKFIPCYFTICYCIYGEIFGMPQIGFYH